MKKIAAMTVLAAMLVVGMMAMPANAEVGAFVFNGTASLNSGFPCTGACNGTFSGTARGATVLPTNNCATGCPFTANYTYSEPDGTCVAGHPAAALGTANGTYNIGSINGGFSWTRVGVTAILVLSNPTGVAVAGFIPPDTCAVDSATVAGLAVVA